MKQYHFCRLLEGCSEFRELSSVKLVVFSKGVRGTSPLGFDGRLSSHLIYQTGPISDYQGQRISFTKDVDTTREVTKKVDFICLRQLRCGSLMRTLRICFSPGEDHVAKQRSRYGISACTRHFGTDAHNSTHTCLGLRLTESSSVVRVYLRQASRISAVRISPRQCESPNLYLFR